MLKKHYFGCPASRLGGGGLNLQHDKETTTPENTSCSLLFAVYVLKSNNLRNTNNKFVEGFATLVIFDTSFLLNEVLFPVDWIVRFWRHTINISECKF